MDTKGARSAVAPLDKVLTFYHRATYRIHFSTGKLTKAGITTPTQLQREAHERRKIPGVTFRFVRIKTNLNECMAMESWEHMQALLLRSMKTLTSRRSNSKTKSMSKVDWHNITKIREAIKIFHPFKLLGRSGKNRLRCQLYRNLSSPRNVKFKIGNRFSRFRCKYYQILTCQLEAILCRPKRPQT